MPKNTLGIGDDCAVIPQREDESLLITTDLLVEGIHFLKDKITAKDLGHKSLAVNLSDIAAMGGIPEATFLSIALPKETELEWIDSFFEGYRELSEEAHAPLMGGDTTKSPDKIVINVAVLGKAKNNEIKYRSTAKSGDIIAISGLTGESAGGLEALLNDYPHSEIVDYLIGKHNRPKPHLDEGRFLSQYAAVHAMMDISDGIDSDLRHILKRSGVSAKIYLNKLPKSKELLEASKLYSLDYIRAILAGGEDYVLLITIDKNEFESIANSFRNQFGKELYPIGEIVKGEQKLHYYSGKIRCNSPEKVLIISNNGR